MSTAASFDANRRLAELALWVDASARWLDSTTQPARSGTRRARVDVSFDRTELATFVSGFNGVARTLMGLAQPVPPQIPQAPPNGRARLRLVKG